MTVSKAKRESLDKSDFGLPSKAKGEAKGKPGNYPIQDEAHARSALSRVSQHGTPAEKATVRRRVAKKYPDIDVSGTKKGDKK